LKGFEIVILNKHKQLRDCKRIQSLLKTLSIWRLDLISYDTVDVRHEVLPSPLCHLGNVMLCHSVVQLCKV